FSYTVTATDNHGGTASTTVSFTITGTNDNPTVSATNPAGFTEALDAHAQDLSRSGTVSFNDIDTNDVIDITFASKNDIVWSGGTIDPARAAQLLAGFSTSANDAAAPGSTPRSYTATDANPHSLPHAHPISFSYPVTATDNHGGTASTTVSFT